MEKSLEELALIVDIVEDMDLPDGAHMAMLEEMTGMDAIDVYTALEELDEDDQCDICGDAHDDGIVPRECETGDGV
jgi:hypothetical protein